MKLKPRHRWFANTDKDACEGWYGPHKTIEAAVDDCLEQSLVDPDCWIYVAQGRKMTKAEMEDFGEDEPSWDVDIRECFEIRILKLGEGCLTVYQSGKITLDNQARLGYTGREVE